MIERGRLVFFAQAIGEENPIYSDLEAAYAAGHQDLPVPPTFLFGLGIVEPDPFRWIADLGIDMRFVLHGEQSFNYSELAHAGDALTLTPVITNVYEKRAGALEFVVRKTTVRKVDGTLVATMEETIVVRHPELNAA
jgi:hypothetical protein